MKERVNLSDGAGLLDMDGKLYPDPWERFKRDCGWTHNWTDHLEELDLLDEQSS